MVSLVHLPPETLIRIFLQLPVDDCLNFAKTCKVINKTSDIELLWVKKICQDFKISADIYSGKYSSHSARNFYRHILYKYGKLLGLWQVTTYGPSGGLLQCVFDNWTLKLIEWFPPDFEIKEAMRPHVFLILELFKDQFCNFRMPYCEWNSITNSHDQLTINLRNELICHIDFPTSRKSSLAQMSEESAPYYVQNFLNKSQIGPCGIGLERVEIEKLYPTNNVNLKQRPIRPGIFKGYYEPHGIELIAVYYPDESTLKAVKLSGDHNVPMNKVTFTADLKKGIILSKEEQEGMDCEELEAKRYPFYFDYSKMQEMIQPFVMPENIDADPSYKPENIGTDECDIKFNYEYCLHRFLGEGQVASANYQDPDMIPAHIVIFDDDTLGCIWLQFNSIGIYCRVKEDLSAIHIDDIYLKK